MENFNAVFAGITDKILGSFSGLEPRRWEYGAVSPWPAAEGNNLSVDFDAALELGGRARGGVNFLCAAESDGPGGTILYGPDLCDIKGEAPYGRITLVTLHGGLDERGTFNAMLDLDVSKHRVSASGFSVSFSEGLKYELVRVSREALSRGVSFAGIGASYIERYMRDPRTKAVTEIFVTDPSYDFEAAGALAGAVQRAMTALRARGTLPRRPGKPG